MKLNPSPEEHNLHLQYLWIVARFKGADRIFKGCGVDVLIATAHSFLSKIAVVFGKKALSIPVTLHLLARKEYPIASMPLGYLDFNGRALGMVALAAAHQDATLLKVMGAWDKTFDPVMQPPMLVGEAGGY